MDWQACREEVKDNICFDQLVEEYGRKDVKGVTDLIADVLTSTQPTVQIGREKVPTESFQNLLFSLRHKFNLAFCSPICYTGSWKGGELNEYIV